MATLIADSWDDVQAVHDDEANDGDTIEVRPDVYEVTEETSITKAVRVVSGGVVDLIDNTPDASTLLGVGESLAGNVIIEGLNFIQGSARHSNPSGVIGLSHLDGAEPILIVNNTYTMDKTNGDFIIAIVKQGVISGNTMNGYVAGANCINNSSFVRHKPSFDSASWISTVPWGALDTTGKGFLYIETNTVSRVSEMIDADNDARTVIRYNNFTNSAVISHGADTSERGARAVDCYNNTWIHNTAGVISCVDANEQNVNGFIGIRGGTILIHDNVIPDASSGTWGLKDAVAFYVENIRRNAGPFACWSEGYPSPYQCGWGWITGATEYGTTGIFGDLEPIYIWNNTGAGNYDNPGIGAYSPNECGGGAPEASEFIQVGREINLDTAKPGYSPFVYPHPLISGIPPEPPPIPSAFRGRKGYAAYHSLFQFNLGARIR